MSGVAEGEVMRTVVPCDGAAIPSAWKDPGSTIVPVRSRGEQRELNLRIDGLGQKVTGRLDKHANDLVRIAAYAFAADQLVSRGGKSDPDRRRWRRELDLVVPVANPDFWAQPAVTTALIELWGSGRRTTGTSPSPPRRPRAAS